MKLPFSKFVASLSSKVKEAAKYLIGNLVAAINVRRSRKQVWVLVEIIPREITDIVSKSIHRAPKSRREVYDFYGCKSIDDAIINAEKIGSRLIENVKTENLLFCFGETVQSLQSGLREFCDRLSVPYPAEHCYGPIYTEQDTCGNEGYGEPHAIVLCKIVNSEPFEQFVRQKKKQGGDDSKRYEITWSELQKIQQHLWIIGAHGIQSDAKRPESSSGERRPHE